MLSTVKTNCLLPFHVISAATHGDIEALSVVLKHYDNYIKRLSTRTVKDDSGNSHSYVDDEMYNRLKLRLITRTLAFNVS